MASPNSVLPPQSDEEQNRAYNPGEQHARELNGSHESIPGYDRSNDGLDDHPISAGDDSGEDVRNAEEKGGWSTNVSSSYAGKKSEKGRVFTQANFKALIKKRGPLAAILTVVVGGGGLAIFSLPTLLMIHVQELFVDKFDSQNTSLTIRTNKVLGNKLANQTTEGSCNVVKIACRYARPSNSFLKNMEDNGIRAIDAEGNTVERNNLFPNARPASYEYTNGNGEKIILPADEFAAAARNDPKLRADFHKTYNPRFTSFSDSVYRSIQNRFGFSKQNTLAEINDEEEVKDKLNADSKGADNGVKTELEGGVAGDSILTKLMKEHATKLMTGLKNASKGGAATAVMGGVCLATNIPGVVIGVTRAYQMAQLVKYSSAFLTTASAMKAGAPDLTPEAVSGVGTLLTETGSNGKSAMDSFGMKYALYGDTEAESDNYKSYAPGVGAIAMLGPVNQITSSEATKGICDVAVNPITSAGITAALTALGGATLGATALAAAINLGVGLAVSEVINLAMDPVISAAVPLLQPYMKDLLGLFLGDLTTNLVGEDSGDALASGASHLMGQTANAGGNMPLSIDQAVAYHTATKEVQLAYAEEDRATLSPLDATNQNTFLGQIVGNFMPYLSQFSSLSGSLKTIASIPSMSLASMLNPSSASAANTAAQYSLCEDPAIKGKGIAAGPYCNIEYGIPVKYLDMDPQEVVNALVASGDIDENTGKPKDKEGTPTDGGTASLKTWMALCADGTTDQAANCQITDETALYAVYTVDSRIVRTMDNMDDEDAQAAAPDTGSTDKKAIAAKIVAKNNVTYLGNVHPTMQEIASGASGDDEPCGINIYILKAIDAITDKHSLKISDINRHCIDSTAGGASSKQSRHYAGNGSAIDIAVIDGKATNGRDANALSAISLAMPFLSEAAGIAGKGSQIGQKQCGPAPAFSSGVTAIIDFCTHLHLDVSPPSDKSLKFTPGW